MNSKPRSTRRGGFTLIEMLVVITIIAILASLLVPTLAMAVRKSREAAIAFELNQLASAVEEYKNQMSAYPPDFSDSNQNRQNATLIRFLNKISSNKHREPPANVQALAAIGNLDPSEALVFWLASTYKNTEHPLRGPGDRLVFFEFKQDRLVDPDGDGFYSYLPPYGPPVPYVYFCSTPNVVPTDNSNPGNNGYVYTTGVDAATLFPPDGGGYAFPYKSDTGSLGTGTFQKPTSFQIISAGYDGNFGAQSRNKGFPNATNMVPEDFDNITSFSEGRLDSQLD